MSTLNKLLIQRDTRVFTELKLNKLWIQNTTVNNQTKMETQVEENVNKIIYFKI